MINHRRMRLVQADLFATKTPRPSWPQLPEEAKEQVVPLLVELLVAHQPARSVRKEVTHER